jgi:putative heme iron utilization protein
MDRDSEQRLAHLIRTQRTAALGTLRDGAPFVSLVLFATAEDFSAFYLHISGLARHTRDIQEDPRVSLMLAETDDGTRDPQTLARLSVEGKAVAVPRAAPAAEEIRRLYVAKHPQTSFNFNLGDFALYFIEPQRARYVAGFGKAFNLRPQHLHAAAALDS